MDPLVGDHLLDGDVGLGERRVGRRLVAGLPVEDVVRVLARPVGAVGLVLEVLADHRRVRRHRLERIDQHRQFVIVDVDQFDPVGRDVAVVGQHEGDLLVLEEDVVLGEHRLHVAGERRHVVEAERLEVGGGQHGEHAGQRLGLRRVDRLDPRMGVGRADDVAVEHAGQLQVVDVVALALREADVLDALPLAAEAFELLGALGRGERGVVHSAASWNGTPASLAAAY